jgi:Xaa-Pro aminopeptidase
MKGSAVDIYQEKAAQAAQLLAEFDLDMWLIFVRETAEHTDPVLKLLGHYSITWPAAFIFTRSGKLIAITGKGDDEAVRRLNIYTDVRTYTQSIGPEIVAVCAEHQPQKIAINVSQSDVTADGLTYGMWLNLREYLSATPYVDRLVSADTLIEALRGRKTAQELVRMRAAIDLGLTIFSELGAVLRPGQSELELHAFVHERVQHYGVGTAWDAEHCPGLNAGPDSPWGHVGASAATIQPGQTFHMDFGVMRDGYCSDNQRMWYCLRPGETAAPPEVVTIFNAVAGAIQAAADFVRPGVQGWEVDEVARKFITDAGYEEYPHALGHSVGRYAHDGGVGFYPRWERYGSKPYGTITAGQVFTLELGVRSPFGYISLEEEILITADGCAWLSPPQKEIWLIHPGEAA